jgi:hypothetical protein
MINLKLYPDEWVHIKTPDGAYFHFGIGTKNRAQVIVVGSPEGSVDDYAKAAAFLADWPGFKVESAEQMSAQDPKREEEVRRRGFLSIILERAAA